MIAVKCKIKGRKGVMKDSKVDNIGKNMQQKASNFERLSDDKMRQLFGVKYQAVLFYNFDAKKWNAEKFIEKPMLGVLNNIDAANSLKANIEQCPEFKNLEVAALVFMPIASEKYPGFGGFLYNPSFCMRQYSFNGQAAVATIVVRDLNSGKILPVSPFWIGVGKSMTRYGLAQSVVQSFVKNLLKSDAIKRDFVAINTR